VFTVIFHDEAETELFALPVPIRVKMTRLLQKLAQLQHASTVVFPAGALTPFLLHMLPCIPGLASMRHGFDQVFCISFLHFLQSAEGQLYFVSGRFSGLFYEDPQ